MLPFSGQFSLSTMRFHLIYAGVAFCEYHECVNGLNSNCVEENSNFLPFVCHSCVWKWLFDVYICSSARIIFFLLFHIFCVCFVSNSLRTLTLSPWYQKMCPGGSGPNRIVHVKFIVLPLSTNRSDPPNIVGTGSKEIQQNNQAHQILRRNLKAFKVFNFVKTCNFYETTIPFCKMC